MTIEQAIEILRDTQAVLNETIHRFQPQGTATLENTSQIIENALAEHDRETNEKSKQFEATFVEWWNRPRDE